MPTAVGFSGFQGINQILLSIGVAQLGIKSYLLLLLNITYKGVWMLSTLKGYFSFSKPEDWDLPQGLFK